MIVGVDPEGLALPLRPGEDAAILGLLMHVNDELAGWRTITVLPIVFLLPGSDGDSTVVGLGAGRRSIGPLYFGGDLPSAFRQYIKHLCRALVLAKLDPCFSERVHHSHTPGRLPLVTTPQERFASEHKRPSFV